VVLAGSEIRVSGAAVCFVLMMMMVVIMKMMMMMTMMMFIYVELQQGSGLQNTPYFIMV
jgi:type II secretory pathway component PulK